MTDFGDVSEDQSPAAIDAQVQQATDDRVAELTRRLQATHERLAELLSFVHHGSHNMSTVEGAIDAQGEYEADVSAMMAVQQYATSYKPEYVAALERLIDSLEQGIRFNIEEIIRGDRELYAEATESGLTDELVLTDGKVYPGRLQYDELGNPKVEMAECGACGFRWNDALITSITPVPSARCPNEYNHPDPEEDPA